MNNYEDIINLEHYEPKHHKRMDMISRAAQFAPFAALTGYEDEIHETARRTNKKIELSIDDINIINNKLKLLEDYIKNNPIVSVTYFVPDKYKSGGNYIDYKGIVRRIDNIYKTIYFKDKTKINIKDIIDIEID